MVLDVFYRNHYLTIIRPELLNSYRAQIWFTLSIIAALFLHSIVF